jgi:hypothetical protein
MKKSIKKKWLEALRSGKYKQTVRNLKDNNGYCCLGVLCDVYAKEHPELARWSEYHGFVAGPTIAHKMPPVEVYVWSGLRPSDASMLAHHNDPIITGSSRAPRRLRSYSFKTIAELIENYL